jgi:hypothetical protein
MSRAQAELLAAAPEYLTGRVISPNELATIAGIDPVTAYARLRLACAHDHATRVARGRYRITTGWAPALRSLVCPKHQGQPARIEEVA